MVKYPLISVVISAYNDLDLMKVLLKKLYQTKYPHFEVVVVDDASPLEDLSVLKKLFPIRYYRNKKNLGAAETKNIAARKAKGEILLSLDNDVKPLSDIIWETYQFFKKNPKVVAVTGFPGTGAENNKFFAKYKYLRDWAYWHLDHDEDSFFYFRPAIGAIRRKAFLDLKGYDTNFCWPGKPAVEDLEFSYRLSKLGKIVFNPKMVVGHPFGGLRKLIRTYFERTSLFLRILKEKQRFSGVATTKKEVLTIVCAGISAGLFFMALFFSFLWLFFGFFLTGLIYFQRLFLWLCFKKEGALFAIGAFFTSWLLYLVIWAGAGWEGLNLLGCRFKPIK